MGNVCCKNFDSFIETTPELTLYSYDIRAKNFSEVYENIYYNLYGSIPSEPNDIIIKIQIKIKRHTETFITELTVIKKSWKYSRDTLLKCIMEETRKFLTSYNINPDNLSFDSNIISVTQYSSVFMVDLCLIEQTNY